MTLALGIGANAAIFGALKSVLLDPLPYADASRLVHVYGRCDGTLSAATERRHSHRDRSATAIVRQPCRVYALHERCRVRGRGGRAQRTDRVGGARILSHARCLGGGRANFRKEDSTSGLVPLSDGQLAPDTAGVALVTHAAWGRFFAR